MSKIARLICDDLYGNTKVTSGKPLSFIVDSRLRQTLLAIKQAERTLKMFLISIDSEERRQPIYRQCAQSRRALEKAALNLEPITSPEFSPDEINSQVTRC